MRQKKLVWAKRKLLFYQTREQVSCEQPGSAESGKNSGCSSRGHLTTSETTLGSKKNKRKTFKIRQPMTQKPPYGGHKGLNFPPKWRRRNLTAAPSWRPWRHQKLGPELLPKSRQCCFSGRAERTLAIAPSPMTGACRVDLPSSKELYIHLLWILVTYWIIFPAMGINVVISQVVWVLENHVSDSRNLQAFLDAF